MIAEKKNSSRLVARLKSDLGLYESNSKSYFAVAISCSFSYCFNDREATTFWESAQHIR